MQIDAGGNGSFDKGFAQAVLTEDDERDRALDARAATPFFARKIVRSLCKRRLAHVSPWQSSLALQHLQELPLGQGKITSLDPNGQMLAEARPNVDVSLKNRASREPDATGDEKQGLW